MPHAVNTGVAGDYDDERSQCTSNQNISFSAPENLNVVP